MTGGVVAAAVVVDGADDRQLVGDLGLFLHQLTEVYAGDICFNNTHRAAIFGGGLGLGVVGLDVRRAAGQLDIDDAGFLGGTAGLCAGLEQLRQCEATKAQKAGLQKGTACLSVAECRLFVANELDHVVSNVWCGHVPTCQTSSLC